MYILSFILICTIYAHIFEYLTHRFVMHKPYLGRFYYYIEHAIEHHGKGRNDINISINPLSALVVGSPLLLAYFWMGWTAIAIVVSFCLLYSSAWLLLHNAHHDIHFLWMQKIKLYWYWRNHHLRHHKHTNFNFGAVFPWTDYLFGTYLKIKI